MRNGLFAIVVVLVLILGGVVGVFARRAWSMKHPVAAGWCCLNAGNECTWGKDVRGCNTGGGLFFDPTSQITCDSVCLQISE